MKHAAVQWYNAIPERQKYLVSGFLRDLRLCYPPNDSYYNQSKQVAIYCTLYQFKMEDKFTAFGNERIKFNEQQNEAKVYALRSQYGICGPYDGQNVYGSQIIDPKLPATYFWEVRIFSDVAEDGVTFLSDLAIGFIGQPDQDYIPPMTECFLLDEKAQSGCLSLAFDGTVEGLTAEQTDVDLIPELTGHTGIPWRSQDLCYVIMDTKAKRISMAHGHMDYKDDPEIDKWLKMEFDGNDAGYRCEQIDRADREFDDADQNDELWIAELDWKMPMRLAICVEGNGYLKLNTNSVHFRDLSGSHIY